jgi:hypothetical protein
MNVTIDRNLLLDFFLTFAAFEFSLKSLGFRKKGRPIIEGVTYVAQPDWASFALQLRDNFRPDADPRLRQACDHLLYNPPWHEVISGSKLLWDTAAESEQLSEIERLLKYVRRVRNNLFHGGKFTSLPVSDLGRNAALIEDSLVILKECLRLSDTVRAEYDAAIL